MRSCLPLKKNLLTSPAAYPYFETLTKTFLASKGLHSWKQEDSWKQEFAREPIRRLAIYLNTNEFFLGNNPFHFQKYDFAEIYIYRNGLRLANIYNW